jgi:predicted HTH domain antitoxin
MEDGTVSTFTLEVQLPEALHEFGFGDEEICREVPVLLVMKRFREGVISSGRAARILGMSRREFLGHLAREGFPIYNPTDEELAHELQSLRNLPTAKP